MILTWSVPLQAVLAASFDIESSEKPEIGCLELILDWKAEDCEFSWQRE